MLNKNYDSFSGVVNFLHFSVRIGESFCGFFSEVDGPAGGIESKLPKLTGCIPDVGPKLVLPWCDSPLVRRVGDLDLPLSEP